MARLPHREAERMASNWSPCGPTRRAVIIGAGARGNHVFAEMMRTRSTGWEVAAVVEPNDLRRNAFRERHGLPESRAFRSVEALLSGPTIADFAFICTPDPTHFDVCAAVSAAGYDVLLEKPIATSLPDCLALLEVHRTSANQIYVAHVLRYSPFFRAIRALLQSGQYGDVRSLHLSEMIGHWHFAHSYVRGNWRRRDESAPIVLTKSSHDLDIITWLMPQERVIGVSSVGSLAYFKPELAPEGAAHRCVSCPLQRRCLYSATELYLTDRVGWPFDSVDAGARSLDARRFALETGPYGRCVWRCDNDVCDNQTVTLSFASGIHATLRHPHQRGRISFLQIAVPTRTGMDEFQFVRRQVEEAVGRINGSYGTIDWRPVLHFYGSFDRPELTAFYRAADLVWVTPMRDGLNLVAKEYVAAKPGCDGMVILSEFAGVAAEMPGPILVNPYSPDDMDRALERALTLNENERQQRMKQMRERVLAWNVSDWAESFLGDARALGRGSTLSGRQVPLTVNAL
jgi:hypothetical protein